MVSNLMPNLVENFKHKNIIHTTAGEKEIQSNLVSCSESFLINSKLGAGNNTETAKGKLIKIYSTSYHFDRLFNISSTPSWCADLSLRLYTPAMMSVYCMIDLEVEKGC